MTDKEIKNLSELLAFLLKLEYFEERNGEIIFECEPEMADRLIQTFISDCSVVTYNASQKRIKFKGVHMSSLIWQGLDREEPCLPQEIWDYIDESIVGTLIDKVDYVHLDDIKED